MSAPGFCEECRYYRNFFCTNRASPYGGKVRLPVHRCHAHVPNATRAALKDTRHDADA